MESKKNTNKDINFDINYHQICMRIAFYRRLVLRELSELNIPLGELGLERKYKWIEINPNVCHGKPVFRGTRVLVADVLEMIASGMSIEEILEEYSQLNKEMILEAIALAAELLRRERRVIPIST